MDASVSAAARRRLAGRLGTGPGVVAVARATALDGSRRARGCLLDAALGAAAAALRPREALRAVPADAGLVSRLRAAPVVQAGPGSVALPGVARQAGPPRESVSRSVSRAGARGVAPARSSMGSAPAAAASCE